MTYPADLRDLVSMLQILDRSDRIQMLIDIAGRFREVPEDIARRPYSDQHKVPACESEAYVWAERGDDADTFTFHFAVDNPQGISAKAMAVILGEHLSGRPVTEVASVSGDLVYDVFGRELSMGKSMGLMGMVSMVTQSAKNHLAETRLAETSNGS
ncbi:MAG: SufE family protein [Thermoanaerobaculia bacterium]|nr:SufE family protein [Thermoanaerobaculia bacterium]